MRRHRYFTYILSNPGRTLFYTGVTNNLGRRLGEHRRGDGARFTRQYGVHVLLYYEEYRWVLEALGREKQIKRWSRAKKLALVRRVNPSLRALLPPA